MQHMTGNPSGRYEYKHNSKELTQTLDTAHPFFYHSDFITTPYKQFAKPEQPDDLLQSIFPADLYDRKEANHSTAGIMTPFLNQEGQLDIDKVFSTVGKASSVYQQLSPVIRDVGTLITNFKS